MRPQNEDQLMQAIHDGAALISSEDCKEYCKNMLKYIWNCITEEEITVLIID